jgi:hypothetical protein
MRGVGGRLLLFAAFVALLGVALVGAAGSARADNPMLVGDVGLNDAYTISLKDASGAPVTHLDTGTYTLVVHDHSSIHNFDLNGPGVSAVTDIPGIGDQTFTITITDGTYFFQCDEHAARMHGSFTAGSVTTPPPKPKPTPTPATRLAASIGPGTKFSLKPASGLSAGKFRLAVNDRSTTDGFRLAGPGVAKSTSAKFRGSVIWTGTLKQGTYSFGSLKHAKLRRSFSVSG